MDKFLWQQYTHTHKDDIIYTGEKQWSQNKNFRRPKSFEKQN